MKRLLLIAGLMAVCGCGKQTYWDMKHVPTTDSERAKVAEETERILAATPRNLSGHDQDWDDAIQEAKETAMETWCKPTLWKRFDYTYTGQYIVIDGEDKIERAKQ